MIVKANKQHPETPYKKIELGHFKFALVDPDIFDTLNQHKWYAKKSFHCWYAVRKTTVNGKAVFIFMHRRIAQTPYDQVCHHQNGNSLDNRTANLLNMNKYDHKILHSYR